jgi:hypothetical protein
MWLREIDTDIVTKAREVEKREKLQILDEIKKYWNLCECLSFGNTELSKYVQRNENTMMTQSIT